MNNLQPLKWVEGLEYITAKSPLHTYTIFRDGGKLAVSYQPINGSVKEATGFRNYAECEQWAWNHYNEKMQPYVKPDMIGTYFDKFTQWGLDRGIIQNGNELAQGLKLVSEMGELADNLAKGRCIKDDIGDCFVVLNNLAHMTGLTLEDCMAQAWNDIKDRKGTMNEHGVFIKSGDVG